MSTRKTVPKTNVAYGHTRRIGSSISLSKESWNGWKTCSMQACDASAAPVRCSLKELAQPYQ